MRRKNVKKLLTVLAILMALTGALLLVAACTATPAKLTLAKVSPKSMPPSRPTPPTGARPTRSR